MSKEPQERSDRSHGVTEPQADGDEGPAWQDVLGKAIQGEGFPLRPGRSVPSEPEDRCSCSHLLTQKARTHEGPHHDEACALWCLPDYGIFQPDE